MADSAGLGAIYLTHMHVRLHVIGQQLNGCNQTRNRINQCKLHIASQGSGPPQRPMRWHVHMHVDETSGTRAARCHMVKTNDF